ncbi:unnamed protein product [Paramecium sonneborni]|uniref:Uncharacterized protein n=1 Tax=Paramecium sonneborni TaxID=65129 RepID=A0A8S1LJ71_9CILI|nr:unnamed protein product [Paramecium sonneborni]
MPNIIVFVDKLSNVLFTQCLYYRFNKRFYPKSDLMKLTLIENRIRILTANYF